MGTHQSSDKCPNCGKEASLTQWTKPRYEVLECPYCGLTVRPVFEYDDLQSLNDRRKENGMRPLKNLPEQKSESQLFS